ncbi:hypothetical protein [Sorangium cellulosum]|uniref:hypothetical protein n=1 Tax=Sorangium cellulosum TaxID=56 RepID=UPI000CF4353D|nr:hypothetical protein [Sorangium cellulosum]
MKIPLFFSAVVAVLAALAPAGCDPIAEPRLCGEIPRGGCPIGRGGSCDDAVCHALYDCIDGAWTEALRCDRAGEAGQDAGAGGGPGGDCEVVGLDRAGEASGCEPALQEPDCPADAAETCAASACWTGCLDFFLCTEEGWRAVAYCDEAGRITVTP